MRKLTIIIIILLFSAGSFNAIAGIYLGPDSVGLKKIGGKKFLIHKVVRGENLTVISQKYNVTLKQVEEANPDLSDRINIDQIVFIPYNEPPSIGRTDADSTPALKKVVEKPVIEITKVDTQETPVQDQVVKIPLKYKVRAGDNLGKIGMMYHTSVASLMSMNNLKTDFLSIDQNLIVGYSDSTPVSATVNSPDKKQTEPEKKPMIEKVVEVKKSEIDSSKTVKKGSAEMSLDIGPKKIPDTEVKKDTVAVQTPLNMAAEYQQFNASNKPLKDFQEKGVAAWIDDEDVNPRKYFALHKTAPVGTIVKVTNIFNGKTIFVKVVGSLPETGDNTAIIIKISKAAAGKLEVLDARFQAILDYSSTQY